jgi:hypothetical protein
MVNALHLCNVMKLFFEEGKRPRHTKTKKQKEYKGTIFI